MKAMKITASVIALLVISIAGFLLTFDVSQYKGPIQEQAKVATGREVKIGDIKLSILLNPVIANADKGLVLVTDKMEVVSTGKIELAQEQLDLTMRPKATSGISVGLGNLTQSLKLAGPLSNLGVKVDAKGAVKALGTLGAAFATGGASLLAQGAAEKVDAGGDPCVAARTWHQKSSVHIR